MKQSTEAMAALELAFGMIADHAVFAALGGNHESLRTRAEVRLYRDHSDNREAVVVTLRRLDREDRNDPDLWEVWLYGCAARVDDGEHLAVALAALRAAVDARLSGVSDLSGIVEAARVGANAARRAMYSAEIKALTEQLEAPGAVDDDMRALAAQRAQAKESNQ